MSINLNNDYHVDVARDRLRSVCVVHKFGHNDAIGTSYVPITDSGIYQTPTSLTSLEVVSSSTDDAAAGTGARKVRVYGLSTDWEEVTEEITLNGTTAVALANQYYRVYRLYITESGTYATSSSGSHVGTITLRVASAGAEWARIGLDGTFPLGQSEIGAYTVPSGKTAYVQSVHIHVNSNKAVDLIAFRRDNADDVTAGYTGAMRTFGQFHGIASDTNIIPKTPIGPFHGPCDIGFMGKVGTGTGSAFVDFEILLFDA